MGAERALDLLRAESVCGGSGHTSENAHLRVLVEGIHFRELLRRDLWRGTCGVHDVDAYMCGKVGVLVVWTGQHREDPEDRQGGQEVKRVLSLESQRYGGLQLLKIGQKVREDRGSQ